MKKKGCGNLENAQITVYSRGGFKVQTNVKKQPYGDKKNQKQQQNN